MADAHANFAISTVATVPDPPRYGLSLVVAAGEGALFPTPPFNATVWPVGEQPTNINAEIVRVTAINTDTFTIERVQEDTTNRRIGIGDQIAATLTSKVINDAENTVMSMSPFILGSGAASGVQTLNNNTGSTGTGSLFMFPVTISQEVRFNQIVLGNSLSLITSNNTISNSYYSKFGLYSMNGNTLSLISSNSFSIGETLQSASATWNYPTTTHTTGYGYGGFPAGNLTATAVLASYVTGTRAIGLQFEGNFKLSPDVYYIGLLSLRSTGNMSTFGLSNMGIIGQPINPINQAGTVSGLLPFGIAGSQWTASNSHLTGWQGRHIVGFMTATSITNFLGTAIPDAVTLSALGGAASLATILPAITFVST